MTLGLGRGRALYEKVPQEGDESLRTLERDRVTCSGDECQCGVGADGLDCSSRDIDELAIEGSGHREHRHVELAKSLPQRLLCPCASRSKRCAKTRSGVLEPTRAVGLLLGQVREQRPGEPCLDELRHGSASSVVELGGSNLVCLPAKPAARLVRDARVRADDHEALDESRRLESEMQAAATTQRIPDIRRSPTGLAKVSGGLCKTVPCHRGRGAAVTGKVRRDDLEVAFERVRDAPPRPRCLGEAVNEGHSRPRAGPNGVQPRRSLGVLGRHRR